MNTGLQALIRAETAQAVSNDVAALAEAIRARGNAACILFYGSGLWKEGAPDTLYDFYVIVDRYRAFDGRAVHAALGHGLPPNVYYMEVPHQGRTLRCKYAVMRMDQFARGAAGRAMTPQIWARFAQPCRIVCARDSRSRDQIVDALVTAVLTFHRRAFSLTPSGTSVRDLWLAGLSSTYAAELRSERPERTAQLYDAARTAFERRTELMTPQLQAVRRHSAVSIVLTRLKRPVQKFVAFGRLIKAIATFDGAVDYALWKIERQSGVRLMASERQRRHPLIFAWPLLWAAYKKGGLR